MGKLQSLEALEDDDEVDDHDEDSNGIALCTSWPLTCLPLVPQKQLNGHMMSGLDTVSRFLTVVLSSVLCSF